MLPLHLWSSGLLSLAFEMKWFLIWIFTLFLALARVFLSLPPCFVSTSHLDLLMFKAFQYYLNLNILFCFLTLSWVACPPLRFHSIDILKVSKLGQAIVKFYQSLMGNKDSSRFIITIICKQFLYIQGGPKKRAFSKHNRFSWITQPRMHQF